MRSKTHTSNINFYFTILQLLKKGKTPTDISKELNTSKQKISYYTRRLKEFGLIEKKGYGVWEVKRSKRIDLEDAIQKKKKQIRGHAFIWKVKPKIKLNWINILESKNIHYNLVRGCIPRIYILNKKVWLTKETIIIYETKSFYGRNAIESRKYAVWELKKAMHELQKMINIKLEGYFFMTSREHFGMIKNELARQVNDRGEKIIVEDSLDGEWLWIDDSESLGELETGGKGFTKDRAYLNLQVQKWFNDMKQTDFKITPSFLIEKLDEANNNFNEIGNSIKKSSEIQMDSELRIKQMESRLRGQEELILMIIDKLKGI